MTDNPVYFIELEFEQLADQIIMHLNESPLGELRTPFAYPFPQDALSAKLEAIERQELSRAELAAFGRQLYQALEQTRVGEAVRAAVGEARRNRGQVILQLRFDEHSVELASLPWELVHDGHRYLLATGAVDLVRYITYPEAVVPLEVTPPLRILQVIASPSGLPPIDVAKARASLNEVPNLIVERLPFPTYDCLLERLEKEPRLHVFHFDGHGTLRNGQSFLYFEDEDGTGDAIDVETLRVALHNQVSLVVLNACRSSQMIGTNVFSGLAPALIEAGIPAVVGMQFSLSDDAAARFAEVFYGAIARFESLTQALAHTRKRLWRENAWYIPTLYLRSRDKTGQLFCKGAVGEEQEELEPEPVAPPESAFPSQFVGSFPYPIAVLCDEFNRTDRREIRFQRLDALFCNSVKYLASVALAQYRQDAPDQESLRLWLRDLSSRHLSSWAKLLDEIAGHYRQKAETQPTIMGKLLDAYDRPVAEDTAIARAQDWLATAAREDTVDASPRSFIQQLTAYRQQTWEASTAHLDKEFYQVFLPMIQPALRQLLELMTLITDYPLRYAERGHRQLDKWTYDMLDFRGPRPEPTIGQPFSAPSAGDEPPHKPFRLYLCAPSGEPLLNLHPLLISLHGRLYFLEAYGEDERLCYRPCYGGELFELPDHLRLALMTCLKPEEQGEEETPSTELDKVEDQIEELEKSRSIGLSLPDLIGRLDPDGRQAIKMALGEALRLGHFWLGVEFLLMALCRQKEQPLRYLLREVSVAPGTFRGLIRGVIDVRRDDWREQRDLASLGAEALPNLREADPTTLAASFVAGEEPPPVVTPRMMQVLRDAARLAGEGQIDHGHLLLATLRHPQCLAVNMLYGLAVQKGWEPEEVPAWVAQQADLEPPDLDREAELPSHRPSIHRARPDGTQPPLKVRGVLAKYGRDLTALAQRGELRPAVGESAHKAMVQMGLILQQTQANNPILLGDPGVGKTAIVEGFAYRLATDPRVIPQLASKRVVDLPSTALLAGTRYRGDLEERLQQLVQEVRETAGEMVVFIDEMHTILGGRAEGGLGVIADALKPALARGEFPCIGATTVGEYRRHIEADPALARRFTAVWIEEPSVEEAIEIVHQAAQEHLGPSHGVAYPQAVVKEAVRLSVRYLHDERLPGKAVKLLDQAGPRAVMGGSLSGRGEADQDQPLGGEVTVEIVRDIVSERTGVPLTQLSKSDKERLLGLEARLKERVKGQDEAIVQVARVVKRARAGLADPRRPLGVFLFAGPTGVGKTELGLALAEALFDEEDAILRLDMSEYMEKHQVSRLIGSPPGYVGYQEEGQLTGRLRRRPYSVVLLDDIEKTHEDVQHLFLQLFDAGRLTDARGNLADGRNAIFIMTTNLGAKVPLGFAKPQMPGFAAQMQAAIEDHFTPEFLNRIDRIVYFKPLDEDTLLIIFDRQFAGVAARLREQGIEAEVTEAFKRDLCKRHTDATRGARRLQRAIEDEIVAPLTDKLLAGEIEPGMKVVVGEGSKMEVSDSPALRKVAGDVGKSSPPAGGQPDPGMAAAGALGMDPEEAHNRQIMAPLLGELKGQLRAREIKVELDEGAWELLCSPFWAEQRAGLGVADAFERLVREPLMQRVEAGEFKTGDRVEGHRNLALEIDFRKLAGDEQ